MIGWLLLAATCLALVATGIVILVRRLRSTNLVSPILLDEALDPDLFALCRRLRRAGWLSAERRRQLAAELLSIQALRLDGGAASDEARIAAVRDALRSKAGRRVSSLQRDGSSS